MEPRLSVIELVRTNDLVLISRLEALFSEADLRFFVADQHMSAVEGSLGFLPRRIMVARDDVAQAKRLMREVGLGDELRDA
jgi:hypothetical protein